jgi:hypothetical protein
MLEQIRNELLVLLAASRQDELLRKLLDEVLKPGQTQYDLATAISARLQRWELDKAKGISTTEELDTGINRINDSLATLIYRISDQDLRSENSHAERLHIPPFHVFGVDRIPQEGQFFDEQFDAGDKKVHFYYLQGGVRQKTDSLAERLGFKLVGLQLTVDDLTAGYEVEPPLVINCTPVLRGVREEQYRASLIHAIAQQFMGPIPMGQMRGMLELKLTDLLDRPKMKRADGSYHPIVCINVTIGNGYWRKDIIPPMVRAFYDNFCQVDLPEGAPVFYFFFGLEYSDKRPKVREEVSQAIAARERGSALPELEAVPLTDIATWFDHHEVMLPDGYDADQLVAENFPATPTIDMLEVEAGLQRLIDKFNEGLTLTKNQ